MLLSLHFISAKQKEITWRVDILRNNDIIVNKTFGLVEAFVMSSYITIKPPRDQSLLLQVVISKGGLLLLKDKDYILSPYFIISFLPFFHNRIPYYTCFN